MRVTLAVFGPERRCWICWPYSLFDRPAHSVAKARSAALSGTYNYNAGLAETYPFQERHKPGAGGNVGLLVREPVGVVAAIIPWNGPPGLIAYKCAPAVAPSSPEFLQVENAQCTTMGAGRQFDLS